MYATKLPIFFYAPQPNYWFLERNYPALEVGGLHLCGISSQHHFLTVNGLDIMTAKHFFAASFCLMGITTLSAQVPTGLFQIAGITEAGLSKLFSELAQLGMAVLLGMILLIAIAWGFCIWNACAGLNKKPKNRQMSSLPMVLCLVVGLSALGSSCSSTQQVRTANSSTTQAPECGYAACRVYNSPLAASHTRMYNQYPYYSLYGMGRPFCKRCNHRVYGSNR